MKFPDAPRFVEIEPDEKRLPDDVLVRHETPDATVRRVVAVVAHHEIVPRRHGAGYALAIVVAIFAKGERPREWNRRGRVTLQKDGVLDPAYRLDELRRVMDSFAIEIVGDLPARLNDPVDRELPVFVHDLVSGDTDHALDVIDRRILRVTKHHDVAPLRIPDIYDFLVEEGKPDAVRELVHQDEITHYQRRYHRAGGNLERFDEERSQHEHDQDDREETLRVFDPPGFLVVLAALLVEVDAVGQGEGAREKQQNEKYQGEVHLLSTWSMARNASWGISTVPTCFMRFLPAFCFSSSFL